jgi:hypothetical protein
MDFGDPSLPWLRRIAQEIGRDLTRSEIERARELRVQGWLLRMIAHDLTAQPRLTVQPIESPQITTPEHILKVLRQSKGLDANDNRDDAELNDMSPMTKLRALAASELGNPDWADQFITWAKQCGIAITAPHD